MEEYKETNRQKKLKARHSRSWCHSCDRALVSSGSKCPNCGIRTLPIRNKK